MNLLIRLPTTVHRASVYGPVPRNLEISKAYTNTIPNLILEDSDWWTHHQVQARVNGMFFLSEELLKRLLIEKNY